MIEHVEPLSLKSYLKLDFSCRTFFYNYQLGLTSQPSGEPVISLVRRYAKER